MYYIVSSITSSKVIKRETASIYVPRAGSVPSSPTMLETTGSLVGQATVMFWKANYLVSGEAIALAPITDTTIYISNSDANARAGVYTYSGSASTNSVTSAITIAAGTWYVTAVSTNVNGTSYISHVLPITVT